jgi:hypothetical protein
LYSFIAKACFSEEGSFVKYTEASAIIAAKDAEIEELKRHQENLINALRNCLDDWLGVADEPYHVPEDEPISTIEAREAIKKARGG